jgi:uncharacterized protein
MAFRDELWDQYLAGWLHPKDRSHALNTIGNERTIDKLFALPYSRTTTGEPMTDDDAEAVTYDFDWNPAKAKSNLHKHGVSFPLATTVLRDPLALNDDEQSDDEDRWISLGRAENGQLLVVVHTWDAIEPAKIRLRIISARHADPGEVRDYQDTAR